MKKNRLTGIIVIIWGPGWSSCLSKVRWIKHTMSANGNEESGNCTARQICSNALRPGSFFELKGTTTLRENVKNIRALWPKQCDIMLHLSLKAVPLQRVPTLSGSCEGYTPPLPCLFSTRSQWSSSDSCMVIHCGQCNLSTHDVLVNRMEKRPRLINWEEITKIRYSRGVRKSENRLLSVRDPEDI